jgi:hypothetical protein
MAKAKSKKKDAAQQIMGVASIAMPGPAREIVTSRWGARLSLVVVAVLVASGILSLQWVDGKPRVKVDRERAAEVEHNLEQRVETRLGHADEKHDVKDWVSDRWNHRKKQQ